MTRRPDTSLHAYAKKRDFAVTAEPSPRRALSPAPATAAAPIFVIQKHDAHRAGLHWDFRLEHDGVLWSWAVRKGPSLDTTVKHIAAHVEDHPLDYADFEGTIPDGEYGAGKVELWDRGTWEPVGDAATGMAKGELTFVLHGTRLNGRFHLVRLKPKPRQRADNWLLFKGHDEFAHPGADAAVLESEVPFPDPAEPDAMSSRRNAPPAPGSIRGILPTTQQPQLCAPADDPPDQGGWVNEIKFDGYRLLIFRDHRKVRVVTRNGNDWSDRLPALVAAAQALPVDAALLDGELVALLPDGRSSFPELQAALSAGEEGRLHFYAFDLLHKNGWDLRPCRMEDRKRVLAGLSMWKGMLRYSDHHQGNAAQMWHEVCRMGLEGIVCKRIDAPYRAGRGHGWVKVKCQGREEFLVLGWTPPRGSRTGVGSLHLGYYDSTGRLHYAGGVGTGFSDDELAQLRLVLDGLAAKPPKDLMVAGDPLESSIHWVKPELVVEIRFIGWSGFGRVRHAVYLGLRADKPAAEVVRDPPDKAATRAAITPKPGRQQANPSIRRPFAVPPLRPAAAGARIVAARPPRKAATSVAGVNLTHPDRELWPGITKVQLAEYWQAVADAALPGISRRPLAIVRCPEGIDGEHFFQKRGRGQLPPHIREGEAEGSPYLAIDGLEGLLALTQVSAIELHPWGATEADPLHPDRLIFDLDPGEGVAFTEVVNAANEVRDRLKDLGLVSFCRTTGGKGLHVVVPLAPKADWEGAKPFCRAFAETLSQEQPERYLSTLKKADRKGRILLDWLRNGLGATAIASYCPRARAGATVATPLAWDEVTAKLDPAALTVRSVPRRLARQRSDPWEGFAQTKQMVPDIPRARVTRDTPPSRPVIVIARPPKRRG